MDHEYMTNVLQPGQAGWDWVSLMFRDGTNVMAFRIRDRAGQSVFSAGGLERAGVFTPLHGADVSLTPLAETWRSTTTGAVYPTGFRVVIPGHGIDTTVRSLLPNQEVPGDGGAGIAYYEGAVRNEERTAIGYLEMTGYARPLDGEL
jgi:predicted secreted hydrolase